MTELARAALAAGVLLALVMSVVFVTTTLLPMARGYWRDRRRHADVISLATERQKRDRQRENWTLDSGPPPKSGGWRLDA